ncbi:MAG: lactate utilization protein C [Bacteroidales bacterium]
MDVRTQKEKVLTKIRHAIVSKEKTPFSETDLSKSVFADSEEEEVVKFAHNFINNDGQFVYCDSLDELAESVAVLLDKGKIQKIFCVDILLKEVLRKHGIEFFESEEELIDAKSTLTRCEYLISRFGSIMVSSNSGSGRRANVYPENHLVVSSTAQIVPSVKEALKRLKLKHGAFPSQLSVISGPSRTADIEKTLVKPAHGPKNLFLFLLPEDKLSSI